MMLSTSLRRIGVLMVVLLCALMLCACAGQNSSEQASEASAAPTSTPEPTATPVPMIDLGGTEIPMDADAVDLDGVSFSVDRLCEESSRLTSLRSITLGRTDLSRADLERIVEAYPEAEIIWSVELLGEEISGDTQTVDLSAATTEDIDAACASLEKLTALSSINTIPAEGVTALEPEQLARLQAAAPDALIECSFELYGKTATSQTEELRYSKAKMDNGAVERFRAVLPYLRSLKLLRLYNCGVTDYEGMQALKNDFPDVNIVWSVSIAGYNFMTDTVLFHCPLLRDRHVELLKYLPDVLYLDVGHNAYLTSIDFVRYFPKLTTIIISITRLSDITALADCPDLEFFEAFSCNIKDITPLSGLTKLEYVNLGDCGDLRSLTPLHGMTTLKLVRLTGIYQHITEKDIKALSESIPDCLVSTYGGHSANSGYWRYDKDHHYTERYALLRKQMLYDIPRWEDRQQDSPTRLPGDRER